MRTKTGAKAVFLDRDGVLLQSYVKEGRPKPPSSLEEYRILPGVKDALDRLRDAGYLLVVVTNQPDVARGTQTREAIEAIHRRLREELPLDGVYMCLHDDPDRCACRKPAPGMLLQAAGDLGIDLSASVMIGDRWSDVEAGKAAGCRLSILVEAAFSHADRTKPDAVAADLLDAARVVLRTGMEVST